MNVTLSGAPFGRADMRWVKRLFVSAFPPKERPPFYILRMKVPGAADWWLVREDGRRAGFCYVIRNEKLAYLFFFAVTEGCRGRGIGAQALGLLQKQYADRNLFLAIEPIDPGAENYALRVRRKAFYERNGFRPLGQWVKEINVLFALLGTAGRIDRKEYDALMDGWRRRFPAYGASFAIGDGDAEEMLSRFGGSGDA